MRGTVVKRLRELVYGRGSRRNTYRYDRVDIGKDRKLVCAAPRADYLEEKAVYRQEKKTGRKP
jgi:hypothetical protein